MSPVPFVSLQVAFGHGPTDPTPVFTEVGQNGGVGAALVENLMTQLGRQHQLDRVEPSTLTAVLDGRRGEFAPWSTLSPYYNLLAPQDALGLADLNWFTLTGSNGDQSTQVLHGAASGPSAGFITSTGSATGAATTGPVYAVTAGQQYTYAFWARAATTVETINFGITWYNASFGMISTNNGTGANDSTTAWTQYSMTVTAPAGAAWAALNITTPISGHTHYFDCVMLSYNPNGVPIGWSPGQTSPVVPGKPIKCIATWSSTPHPVFYGFLDSCTPMPKDALNQEYQLQASDVIKQLNLKYLANSTLYPNTVNALSPLAYWRLDETQGVVAADASGNSRNAVYWGAPTFAQTGAQMYDPDTGVTLANGGNAGFGGSWVVAPTLPNQGSGSHAFSFECWFKTTAASQQIFTWASNAGFNPTAVWLGIGAGGHLALYDGNAQIPPWTFGGFNAEIIASYTQANDGNWHHVVVTMGVPSGSNSTWTLYLDGASVGSWTGEYWSATFAGPLYIGGLFSLPNGGGAFSDDPVGTFSGTIDEVAVYGSVLSGAQILNNYTIGSYFQNVELTGARIAKALIVAGYGSYPQNLAAGTVLCQAETNSVIQSLCGDYILIANDTENGLLYQDPSGTIQFHDRHYPQLNASSVTSQATYGDNSGVTFNYEVTGLSIPQDDLDLWPSVKVQRNNGVPQVVINAAASAASGDRTLQRSALLFESDSDALILAQWLNYLYALPIERVAAVTLSSIFNGGANLPQQLGRALWDAVTIQRQGAGESQLNVMMAVEAIAHSFDASEPSWKTTFQLSPFEVQPKANQVLILNSSTQGILDTNVVGG